MPQADHLIKRIQGRLSAQTVTRWEGDFLESTLRQLNRGKTLSLRQTDKLAQVLESAPSKPVITRPGDVHEGDRDEEEAS